MVAPARSLARAFAALQPRERPYLFEWCDASIVTDRGRPYEHAAYPHLAAPGGPFDAWDNPRVREIVLQWATRLGKTFLGQCAAIYTMATDPSTMMFCSATEKLAKEVTERTYKMMRNRREFRDLLIKPEKFQRQDIIETHGGEMYVAWARSPSTLADKNIRVGFANEIDKWAHASTATEADPLKLFSDRFKDYQSVRKIVFESTPTIAGKSRVETYRKGGTDRALFVPCPSCRFFQKLLFNPDRLPYDDANPGESARYVCVNCGASVENHNRPWMIRRGVWIPAGGAPIHEEALKIAEDAVRGERASEKTWHSEPWHDLPPNTNTRESYQLSSLYALSLTWGDIAVEFINSKGKPQLLRNFINQWLGETWELRRGKSTPEQIAERSAGAHFRGSVPTGQQFLIGAADRQGADGGFVKWTVTAHRFETVERPGPAGETFSELLEWVWVVDYGYAADLPEFTLNAGDRVFSGAGLARPVLNVIDSGYRTKETYDYCARTPRCLAVKGSSGDMAGAPFRLSPVEGSAGLLHVNTDYWETELQSRLDTGIGDNPGAITLPREAARDPVFLADLTNAVLSDSLNARGVAVLRWVKKNESDPNDWRDCIRYAMCAADVYWRSQN